MVRAVIIAAILCVTYQIDNARAASFSDAIDFVLAEEGGLGREADGQIVNRGITEAVAKAAGYAVGLLTERQAKEIYKDEYWEAPGIDRLPPGVDLAVLDFAVHSGPDRAVRFLQKVLGVPQDGTIGPATIEAAWDANPRKVILKVNRQRKRYLAALADAGKYPGWSGRVDRLDLAAIERARNAEPEPWLYVALGEFAAILGAAIAFQRRRGRLTWLETSPSQLRRFSLLLVPLLSAITRARRKPESNEPQHRPPGQS